MSTKIILRLPKVQERVGLSRSTLYAKIKDGTFPAGIKLGTGARAVGWLESDVNAWLECCVHNSHTAS